MSFTYHVGEKFDKNGNALTFRGNTIICFTNDENSDIYRELFFAQEELKKLSFSYKYASLPPSSFHMTAMSLTNESHRNTRFWSPFIGSKCKLSDVDKKFKIIVDSVPIPQNFKMKIDFCNDYRFVLSPFDEETRKALRKYRDEVSEKTGIRADNHDSYTFHITLFYRLQELTSNEEAEMAIVLSKINKRLKEKIESFYVGLPQFTIFNDMNEFHGDLSKRDI